MSRPTLEELFEYRAKLSGFKAMRADMGIACKVEAKNGLEIDPLEVEATAIDHSIYLRMIECSASPAVFSYADELWAPDYALKAPKKIVARAASSA